MNRIIGAILLAFGLTALTACAPQPTMEDAGLTAPAPVEPVVLERKTDCVMTGSDDGIGGTGCKVDAID